MPGGGEEREEDHVVARVLSTKLTLPYVWSSLCKPSTSPALTHSSTNRQTFILNPHKLGGTTLSIKERPEALRDGPRYDRDSTAIPVLTRASLHHTGMP